MAKSQYKFNPEDLNYDRLDDSLNARIWRIAIYAVAVLVLAVLLNVIYSLFFDTPRERQIRNENRMLLQEYEQLSARKQMVDTVMNEVQRIDRDIYRLIFETEPVALEESPSTGKNFQSLLLSSNEEIVTRSAEKLDSLIRRDSLSSSEYDMLAIRGESKAEMLPHFPAIQPIENRDLTLIASGFGYRVHPIYKILKMHDGIDFSAPVGTPVYATGNGVVTSATRSERGLGNQILIDHGYGYETLYACMDELNVRNGQEVKRGDLIGTVGNTGLSVAPHLHYEVHLDGEPMNPINYFFLELSPADYNRLIQISKLSGQSFD